MSSRWLKTRPAHLFVCIGCRQPFFTKATNPQFAACSLRCRLEIGVERNASDKCWPWKHCRDKDGYGEFRFGGKKYKAHRVAFELDNGPILDGLLGTHSCDNPPCCNPNHVRPGDETSNAAEMVARGRANPPRGERSGSVKLSEDAVRVIRKSTLPAETLAQMFGVKKPCIYKIRERVRWRHVPCLSGFHP